MKLHPRITPKRIMDAVRREMFGTDNPGFCIACGADHHECEPDAREYVCDNCGKPTVYGAAELLMEIA
jgi:predicted amidophosphoribosyltransferase